MAHASSSKLLIDSIVATSPANEFVAFKARMRMPIAPCWAADGSHGNDRGQGGLEGVKEVLASWVMRYLPPVQGVLLTFDPQPRYAHQTESFPAKSSPFSSTKAGGKLGQRILDSDSDSEDEGEQETHKQVQLKVLPMIQGSGFTLAHVNWSGTAWRPRVGQTISGSPTLSTPSHISLLLHDLFNASIPATHIPSDVYYFDPDYPVPDAVQKRQKLEFPTAEPVAQDKAEDEGEATGDAADEDQDDVDEEEQEAKKIADQVEEEEQMYRQHGWWLRKDNKKPLGGQQVRIEITIANSMISVTGSLLDDPFASTVVAAKASTLPNKGKKTASSKVKSSTKQRAKQIEQAEEEDDQHGAGRDSEDEVGTESSRSPSPPPRLEPPSVKKAKRTRDSKDEDKDASAAKKKAKSERRKSKA
ncbi:hypothetical protein OIV83_004104 [Microbotryomycetes sp. JL201]|nr:hypothetical protein OIV83_004104 [Microbotryomycetes sp. JL201]